MPYRILTLFIAIVLLVSSGIRANDDNTLVVAWLENDHLMIWRTGDESPTQYTEANLWQPVISSDGQFVVVSTATSGALWLAAPTDADLIELIPNQALFTTDDPKYLRIDHLQRGANNTFYFTTSNHPSHYTFYNHDLWSVDAAARTFKQLLPSQQAGLFNLSPDNQHIAIIQSGGYDKVDGQVTLADNNGQNSQDIMNFPAVSTASDYDFYPQSFWESDSTAFNLALPEKDLVYNDDTAMTTLWRFGLDGSKTQRGTIQATFFGLPQWSGDGKYILYLRHKGEITANQFELVVASGDGANPTVYASGAAGNIGLPQWLPNSQQFIYSQGELGDYWLGQPDHPAQSLPGKIFNPHFVDSTTYVYTTTAKDAFELRYAEIGTASSTLITTVDSPVPVFDAVLLP